MTDLSSKKTRLKRGLAAQLPAGFVSLGEDPRGKWCATQSSANQSPQISLFCGNLQAFEKSISVPTTDWPKEIGEIPGRKNFF